MRMSFNPQNYQYTIGEWCYQSNYPVNQANRNEQELSDKNRAEKLSI